MDYYDFRDFKEKGVVRYIYIDTTPKLAKKFIRNQQHLIDVLQGDLSNNHGINFTLKEETK
ncbi:hypothetical protein BH753_gp044 [Bacillus phage Shbh1]|uniref:Uncharacterized protein n=1 Tax=Bacillus phage Shbh1 TaxID=1796992 RepID=A0A142F169_9CAUD|nr:hypothetical protein BH753_gp044 [Bacillus phage Shbh1]AMQ66526.1 hypothetical protein [Bacillus phage Shbh1]